MKRRLGLGGVVKNSKAAYLFAKKTQTESAASEIN